jgi:hypothetical protein
MSTRQASTRRRGLLCTGLSGVLVAACAGPPEPGAESQTVLAAAMISPPADSASSEELTVRQRRQLQVFGPTVLSPSADIPAEARRAAAEELLAMEVPESRTILIDGLGSGRAPVMLAVAAAMTSTPKPVPWLLEPALDALAAAPREVLDQLSAGLARYDEDGLVRVSEQALQRGASPLQRLGPIHALGWFRSRDAAVSLMTLLEESRGEPAEIVAGACTSLERLTGVPHGSDPARWRRWWDRFRDVPRDQWLALTVQTLSQRLAEIELANEELARRHVESLRELFRVLPLDEQLRRLPVLLGDDIAAVRKFAVDRVARFLRDSERVPPEIQERLAGRLADPAPAIRIDAARLLEALKYEGAALRIAAAAATETERDVLAAYLDILSRQPIVEAIEPGCRLLSHPDLGASAADVLTAVFAAAPSETEAGARARTIIDTLPDDAVTPSHLRLRALIAAESDLARCEAELDGDDESRRRAVADGFRLRGLRAPLLARADDPVLYPAAVAVIAEHASSLADLRVLAALRPTADQHGIWAAALRTCAAVLALGELVEADNILQPLDYVDRALRRDVLARVAAADPGALRAIDLDAAIARYAGLLLDSGMADEAHRVLEQRAATGGGPALAPLRFRAAAIVGQFDTAARLEGDARRWIELLGELAASDVIAAKRLRREIVRRFETRLDGELRELFDRACQGLPEDGLSDRASTAQLPS